MATPFLDLRYEQGTAVLKDRRFQQGNARWPEQNGIHDAPWAQWWAETLLSVEGPVRITVSATSWRAPT